MIEFYTVFERHENTLVHANVFSITAFGMPW